MRSLPALFAVVALLLSPVTAAVAQVACNQAGPEAMAGMDMPSMDGAGAHQAGDPCCDHGARRPMGDKGCAQACAAMAVVAALPASAVAILLSPVRAVVTGTPVALLRSHDPGGFERPPKLSA
jgi:hypothetical protein